MFSACSPSDGFGLAICTSRGIPPASASSDPSTILTFAHRGHELSCMLRHCAHKGVHTGGHVWSGSRHLSRWLYARRHLLQDQRVLELGCGLALPGLLAAQSGATVVATDELAALVDPDSPPTFDRESETMYLSKGATWAGYDSPATIAIKARWVRDQGYAGAMLWSLDNDDFKDGYPIASTMHRLLGPE